MKRPASNMSAVPQDLRELWQLSIPVPRTKQELSQLSSALAAQKKIIASLYDEYVTKTEEAMKLREERKHLGDFMTNLSAKNQEGLTMLKEAEKRIISAELCTALGIPIEPEKESSESSPTAQPPKKKKRVARKTPASKKQP